MRTRNAAVLAAAIMLGVGAVAEAGAPLAAYPAVVGRASGNGAVRIYSNAAPAGAPAFEFVAFPSSFNGDWEMSSALVDNDTIRDLVVAYTAFGSYPELRAYSGVTGVLIAADSVGSVPSDGTVTARYARLGTATRVVVGNGGPMPSVRVLAPSGEVVSPLFIPLPETYEFGVQFAIARDPIGARDLLVTVPRFGSETAFRLYDVNLGTLIGNFLLAGGASLSNMSVALGDVLTTNLGPEVIVATAGPGPKVRVYSLTGALLTTVSFGSDSIFATRVVAVPTGEGPSAGSRILVFADGNFGIDSQVYEVNPVMGTVTARNTGLFGNQLGLRGAVGPVDPGTGQANLWIGSPLGGEAQVQRTTQAYGSVGSGFFAFDTTYNGGVTVSMENVEGGPAPEIVVGAGPGAPPMVRVFTNEATPRLLSQFLVFDPSFRGGVRIATGDLNGDGRAEIVAGPARDGSPVVRVFDSSGTTLNTFTAFPPAFLGGVNLAVGDVAEDGLPEIVVAPNGPGRSTDGNIFRTNGTLVTSFQFGSATFDAPVTVAIGDVNGDGKGDIIAGVRDSASTTRVRVFRGKALPDSGDLLASFEPFPSEATLAANVGFSGNRPGQTGAPVRILVGEGGPGTSVRVFDGTGTLLQTFSTFAPGTSLGVNAGTFRVAPVAGPQNNWVVR